MEFIKIMGGNHGGRTADSLYKYGFLNLISDSKRVEVCIKSSKLILDSIGIIEGGIGVNMKVRSDTDKFTMSEFKTKRCYEGFEDYIPSELRASCYRFKIPAEKISDTEYVFMFKNAKMTNNK